MPSIYAHYLFGDRSISKFPKQLQEIINDNRKFFDLGTSGGDLLFYYKPYKKNPVRSHGSQMHRQNAAAQLAAFREMAAERCNKDRDIAYLAGYYTHFILDSRTHPFIDRMDEEGVARHFVIETDYDRKLLIKYGEDPYDNKYLRFQINDSDTQEIAAKYMNTTPKIIKKTLKDRRKYLGYISSQNKFMRGLLNFLFRISNNTIAFDILVQKREDPKCDGIRDTLEKLVFEALAEVERGGKAFYEFLVDGGDLGGRFDCDFHMRQVEGD